MKEDLIGTKFPDSADVVAQTLKAMGLDGKNNNITKKVTVKTKTEGTEDLKLALEQLEKFERLSNSKNAKNYLVTSQEEAFRNLSKAIDEYNNKISSNASKKSIKESASETAKWSNAFEALGGDIQKLDKGMSSIINNIKGLSKSIDGGLSVDKYKELLNVIKEMGNNKFDFKNVVSDDDKLASTLTDIAKNATIAIDAIDNLSKSASDLANLSNRNEGTDTFNGISDSASTAKKTVDKLKTSVEDSMASASKYNQSIQKAYETAYKLGGKKTLTYNTADNGESAKDFVASVQTIVAQGGKFEDLSKKVRDNFNALTADGSEFAQEIHKVISEVNALNSKSSELSSNNSNLISNIKDTLQKKIEKSKLLSKINTPMEVDETNAAHNTIVNASKNLESFDSGSLEELDRIVTHLDSVGSLRSLIQGLEKVRTESLSCDEAMKVLQNAVDPTVVENLFPSPKLSGDVLEFAKQILELSKDVDELNSKQIKLKLGLNSSELLELKNKLQDIIPKAYNELWTSPKDEHITIDRDLLTSAINTASSSTTNEDKKTSALNDLEEQAKATGEAIAQAESNDNVTAVDNFTTAIKENSLSLEERIALLKEMKRAASDWHALDQKDVLGNDNIAGQQKMQELEDIYNKFAQIIVTYKDGTQGVFDSAKSYESGGMLTNNESFRNEINLRRKIIDVIFKQKEAQEQLSAVSSKEQPISDNSKAANNTVEQLENILRLKKEIDKYDDMANHYNGDAPLEFNLDKVSAQLKKVKFFMEEAFGNNESFSKDGLNEYLLSFAHQANVVDKDVKSMTKDFKIFNAQDEINTAPLDEKIKLIESISKVSKQSTKALKEFNSVFDEVTITLKDGSLVGTSSFDTSFVSTTKDAKELLDVIKQYREQIATIDFSPKTTEFDTKEKLEDYYGSDRQMIPDIFANLYGFNNQVVEQFQEAFENLFKVNPDINLDWEKIIELGLDKIAQEALETTKALTDVGTAAKNLDTEDAVSKFESMISQLQGHEEFGQVEWIQNYVKQIEDGVIDVDTAIDRYKEKLADAMSTAQSSAPVGDSIKAGQEEAQQSIDATITSYDQLKAKIEEIYAIGESLQKHKLSENDTYVNGLKVDSISPAVNEDFSSQESVLKAIQTQWKYILKLKREYSNNSIDKGIFNGDANFKRAGQDLAGLVTVYERLGGSVSNLSKVQQNAVSKSLPDLRTEEDELLRQNELYNEEARSLQEVNKALIEKYKLSIKSFAEKNGIDQDTVSSLFPRLNDFQNGTDSKSSTINNALLALSKILGIEIPNAAEKAKASINEVQNAVSFDNTDSSISAVKAVEDAKKKEAEVATTATDQETKKQQELNSSLEKTAELTTNIEQNSSNRSTAVDRILNEEEAVKKLNDQIKQMLEGIDFNRTDSDFLNVLQERINKLSPEFDTLKEKTQAIRDTLSGFGYTDLKSSEYTKLIKKAFNSKQYEKAAVLFDKFKKQYPNSKFSLDKLGADFSSNFDKYLSKGTATVEVLRSELSNLLATFTPLQTAMSRLKDAKSSLSNSLSNHNTSDSQQEQEVINNSIKEQAQNIHSVQDAWTKANAALNDYKSAINNVKEKEDNKNYLSGFEVNGKTMSDEEMDKYNANSDTGYLDAVNKSVDELQAALSNLETQKTALIETLKRYYELGGKDNLNSGIEAIDTQIQEFRKHLEETIPAVEKVVAPTTAKSDSGLKQKTEQTVKLKEASEEALKIAKEVCEQNFGDIGSESIKKLALEIDEVFSGVKKNLKGDITRILSEDAKFAENCLGSVAKEYKNVREYMNGKNVRIDPNYSSEFTDEFLKVRNTLGSKFLRSDKGMDIAEFIKDMNETLGSNLEILNNPQDNLRQLYEYVSSLRDEVSDLARGFMDVSNISPVIDAVTGSIEKQSQKILELKENEEKEKAAKNDSVESSEKQSKPKSNDTGNGGSIKGGNGGSGGGSGNGGNGSGGNGSGGNGGDGGNSDDIHLSEEERAKQAKDLIAELELANKKYTVSVAENGEVVIATMDEVNSEIVKSLKSYESYQDAINNVESTGKNTITAGAGNFDKTYKSISTMLTGIDKLKTRLNVDDNATDGNQSQIVSNILSLEKQLNTIKSEGKAISEQENTDLAQRLNLLNSEASRVEATNKAATSMSDRIGTIKNRLETSSNPLPKKDFETANKLLDDYKSKLSKLQDDKTGLNAIDLKSLQSELNGIDGVISKMERANKAATSMSASNLNSAKGEYSKKISRLSEQVKDASFNTEDLEKRLQGLKDSLSDISDSTGLAKVRDDLRVIKAEFATLKTTNDLSSKSYNDSVSKQVEEYKAIYKIKSEIDSLNPDIDQSRIDALKEEKSIHQQNFLALEKEVKAYEAINGEAVQNRKSLLGNVFTDYQDSLYKAQKSQEKTESDASYTKAIAYIKEIYKAKNSLIRADEQDKELLKDKVSTYERLLKAEQDYRSENNLTSDKGEAKIIDTASRLERELKFNQQDALNKEIKTSSDASYNKELSLLKQIQSLKISLITADEKDGDAILTQITRYEDLITELKTARSTDNLVSTKGDALIDNYTEDATKELTIKQEAYNAAKEKEIEINNRISESTKTTVNTEAESLRNKLQKAMMKNKDVDTTSLSSMYNKLSTPTIDFKINDGNVKQKISEIKQEVSSLISSVELQESKFTASQSTAYKNANDLLSLIKSTRAELRTTTDSEQAQVKLNDLRRYGIELENQIKAIEESGLNDLNKDIQLHKQLSTYMEKEAKISSDQQKNTDAYKAYDWLINNENKYQKAKASVDTGAASGKEAAAFQLLNAEKERNIAITNSVKNENDAEAQKRQEWIDTIAKETLTYETYYNELSKVMAKKSNFTKLDQVIGNVDGKDTNAALGMIKSYANELGKLKNIRIDDKGDMATFSLDLKGANDKAITLVGSLNKLNGEVSVVSTKTKSSASMLGGMFDSLKNKWMKLTQYITAMYLNPYMLVGSFKEVINEVAEFQDSLTQISYTMDVSDSELTKMGNSAIEMSEKMGTSVSNMMDILKVYSNMQTSTEEMLQKAQPTAILANLSGEDASTATDQIQAITNQFKLAEDDGMHIVDVMDYISSQVKMDFAKGISVIAEATETAGSVVNEAGMDFETYAAMVAKASETTRQSGSELGNAVKTIFTRISKASKLSDEIDNDTLSNASKSLNDIGIQVYKADGTFNNIGDTLGQLAEKWDSLSDAQQSNIAFNVAATRQTNTLRAILNSYADATQLATDAENADGEALADQQKYADSLSGKIQTLSDKWTQLKLSLVDQGSIKGLVDGLSGLLTVLNDLTNAITPLGDAFVAFMSIKAFKNVGRAKMSALLTVKKNADGIIVLVETTSFDFSLCAIHKDKWVIWRRYYVCLQ